MINDKTKGVYDNDTNYHTTKMELVSNIIRISLENENAIYVNALNGAIDFVDQQTDKKMKELTAGTLKLSDLDDELHNALISREYVLEPVQIEQMKKNLMEKAKIIHELRLKQTNFLSFIITYDCNYRCPYCYQSQVDKFGPEGLAKVLTKEMVDRAYDIHGVDVKTIHIFGGEPLLLENYEIVEYILQRFPKSQIMITTNGYHLEEYVQLFLKYKILNIEVTLDGFKNTHNRTRIHYKEVDTFDKTIRGIEAALRLSLNIRIRMNISEENLEESFELKKWLMKKFPYENISFLRNPIFGDSKVCRSQLLGEIIQQEELSESVIQSVTASNPLLDSLVTGKGFNPKYTFCAAHDGNRFCDPFGDLYTCFLAVGDKDKRHGTYYPDFEVLNDWDKRNIETVDACSKCKIAHFCGGGCANAAHGTNGTIFSSFCGPTMDLIKKVVPVIYKIKHDNA